MFKVWLEMSMLALEAHLAPKHEDRHRGGAANREARLMVTEKVSAAQTAVLQAATGTGPASIARGYRGKSEPM